MSDASRFAPVQDLLRSHLATTSSALAAYVANEHDAFSIVVGQRFADRDDAPVDDATLFDLASLTKVLCTTPLVALAVQRGVLRLDEEVNARWPDVTVEDLLRHRSGLPAWLPFFESVDRAGKAGTAEGKHVLLSLVEQTAPEHPRHAQTVYSDLGFIKLGALLEDRLQAPLDVLFADLTHALFADAALSFLPLHDGVPTSLAHIAPTERCPWRKRVVHGQVHDDNCFAMGGVAGHAGLFGTLDATAQAACALRAVKQGTSTWEAADVLRGFMHDDIAQGDNDIRPVGFDKPTAGGSTGGALSSSAVGHLAFSGCSLWLDDDEVYVLLSNRIHPSRDNNAIRELRPAFHQAASRALRG